MDTSEEANQAGKKRKLSDSSQASSHKAIKTEEAKPDNTSQEIPKENGSSTTPPSNNPNGMFAGLKRHLKPESERIREKPKSNFNRRESYAEKKRRENAEALQASLTVKSSRKRSLLKPEPPAEKRHRLQHGSKTPSDRSRESTASRHATPIPKPATQSPPSRKSTPAVTTPKHIREKKDISEAAEPVPRAPSRSPPQKLKRPGAAARVSAQARENALKKQQERDEQAKAEIARRGVGHLTTQHYNDATIMTKQQRRTESKIIGLRDFNNWVKSAVIQKFSPNEGFIGRPNASIPDHNSQKILVVDIGCGKGGDLQKWEKAPQRVGLIVGLDPAENLIDEARRRYSTRQESNRGIFDARYIVRDCFGLSIGEVPIVKQVGFDEGVGPDGNAMARRWGGGGFDVVSMMFCLHYAFENEELARGMLRNVSGCLKKGGRFLGVIVNSDALAAKVVEHYGGEKKQLIDISKPSQGEGLNYDDEQEEDDWNPEKPADAPKSDESDSDWDPEKPAESKPASAPETNRPAVPDESKSLPSWGNSIFNISFLTKPPTDGVFRPPFGWKYDYKLEEAVATPEFVVPFEALRALALDYDLELQWRKPFLDVWESEKNDPILGELSRRMRVCREVGGPLNASAEEQEASSFYQAFCFYKM